MRISYLLCFLMAFSLPAAAADENVKKEIEGLASAYAASFGKKDGAGIAALYASGGVLFTAAGVQADIAKYYDGVFKAGFDRNEATVDQVMELGPDSAISMGEYKLTGKSPSGDALEAAGRWTAVDVREGGKWKIRLLTAVPKPPPPPQQAAK